MGKNLGSKIKKLRYDHGLTNGKKYTQLSLSKAINISRSYLGDIESGRTMPSDDVLIKLAKVFNIDENILLDCKYSELKETKNHVQKDDSSSNVDIFKTPEAAMEFILKQPTIMGYGGFDVNKMEEEDIINFANELLKIIKMIGPKYNK